MTSRALRKGGTRERAASDRRPKGRRADPQASQPRRAGGIRRSPWRARLPLFAVLAVLLVAAASVLIGYHAFYDERFKALERTRAELAAKRDAAAAATATRREDRRAPAHAASGTSRRSTATSSGGGRSALPPSSRTSPPHRESRHRAGPDFVLVRRGRRRHAPRPLVQRARPLRRRQEAPLFVREQSAVSSSRERALATDDIQPDVLRPEPEVAHYFRPDDSAAPRRAGARPDAQIGRERFRPGTRGDPTPTGGVPE